MIVFEFKDGKNVLVPEGIAIPGPDGKAKTVVDLRRIAMMDMEYEVLEGQATDRSVTPPQVFAIRILVLIDPISKLRMEIPLPLEAAEQMAADLQLRKVVTATKMP